VGEGGGCSRREAAAQPAKICFCSRRRRASYPHPPPPTPPTYATADISPPPPPAKKTCKFFLPIFIYSSYTLSPRMLYQLDVRQKCQSMFLFLSGTEASPHQDNNVETPSTDNIVPNRKYTSASCFHPFLAQRFDLSNSNLCSKINARRCLALTQTTL
jgi:hypothetical protein